MIYVKETVKLLCVSGKLVGMIEWSSEVNMSWLRWSPNDAVSTNPYSRQSYDRARAFPTESDAMRWAERNQDHIAAGHAV